MRVLGENLEQKVPVVIASRTILPLERFTQDNIKIIKIPPQYKVKGAVAVIDDLMGMTSATYFYPGEQILTEKMRRNTIIPKPGEKYCYLPIKGRVFKLGEKVDVILVFKNKKVKNEDAFTSSEEVSGLISEKVFNKKVVASILDNQGRYIYDPVKGYKNEAAGSIAGIEILATDDEIKNYLEKKPISISELLVRYGESSDEEVVIEVTEGMKGGDSKGGEG